MPKLSLILPVYNEEAILEKNFEIIFAFLGKCHFDFEIIFANDGSTDRTREIIERLAQESDQVKVVSARVNQGRGGILTRAIPFASSEIVGYLDADLEIGVHYVKEMIDILNIDPTIDIIIGSKFSKGAKTHRAWYRNLAHHLYNILVFRLLGSYIKDHQGGIKFFRKKPLFDLIYDMRNNGWIWDTEILIRAQKKDYTICEYPIHASHTRPSKVKFWTAILVSFNAILWLLFNNVRVSNNRSRIIDGHDFIKPEKTL